MKKSVSSQTSLIPESIEQLALRRKGGRVNIRGIEYQLQFSINKILELEPSHSLDGIRLEGVEDLDSINRIQDGDGTCYQVKFSQDRLNTSRLWNLGVVQNFIETFIIDNTSKFVLVTNQMYSDSKLDGLFSDVSTQDNENYWKQKIATLRITQHYKDWNWINFDFDLFKKALSIRIESDDALRTSNELRIINKFSLLKTNFKIYLNALFYDLYQTAKSGGTVTYKLLCETIIRAKDQIEAGHVSPAIQFKLIDHIDFVESSRPNLPNYFDGQPASPSHVAADLPIPRIKLEKHIENHLDKYDCGIIKSSSGQGKSTLAWRVCKSYHEQGRSIYQLHSCDAIEHTGSLVEFIKTRVFLGEAPIIVIDGLSAKHTNWVDIISRLSDSPVKFIVTSREEDWIRYGRDAYKIDIGEPIGLRFNQQDAMLIFKALKNSGKLHASCRNWQSAWEAVEQKGLLMEYVYLITHGQMLSQRLNEQIGRLNSELDGGTKIKILRVLAFADQVEIKVRTNAIRAFIKDKDLLHGDLGEILNQLELEYYVRFDKSHIEGLHNVRSQHLTDILHKSTPFYETLQELANVIDDKDLELFGFALANFSDSIEKGTYNLLLETLSKFSYRSISELLFGVYRGEVKKYWETHKNVFDSVFEQGSFALLPMLTMPFPTRIEDMLDLISTISKNPQNHIKNAIDVLPKFRFENTIIKYLVTELHRTVIAENAQVETVYPLLRWFWLLNLRLKFPDDKCILNIYNSLSIDDSVLFADAIHSLDASDHESFARRNSEKIIDFLLLGTKSLSVVQNEEVILIQYILPHSESDIANDESVFRANAFHTHLPTFKFYEIEATVFPYPNAHAVQNVVMNAHKKMPPEMLPSSFTVKLNRIWNDDLINPYRAVSMFEWQEAVTDFRLAAVSCAKQSCNLLNVIIRGDAGKPVFDKSINLWDAASNRFIKLNKTLPLFPSSISGDEAAENLIKTYVKSIQDWAQSYLNYINQFSGLLKLDEPETRRLSLINLQSCNSKIRDMQESYDKIRDLTISYFDVDDLKEIENICFTQLQKTSIYYGDNVIHPTFEKVHDPAPRIEEYWRAKQDEKWQMIMKCLDSFTNLPIIRPCSIIEEEFLSRLVVGIEFKNLKDAEEQFSTIAMGMAFFNFTDLDFVTVFICIERRAIFGWRFRSDFFAKARNVLEGGELQINEVDSPLLLPPTAADLATLPGIEYAEPEQDFQSDQIFRFYETLWMRNIHSRNKNADSIAIQGSASEQYSSELNIMREILKDSISATLYNQIDSHFEDITNKPDEFSDQSIVEKAIVLLQHQAEDNKKMEHFK
jgi:hypothetical protein